MRTTGRAADTQTESRYTFQSRHVLPCLASPLGGGRILEEEPVVPDQPIAMAEHECEAERVEEDPAKTCIDNALHQDINRLTRAAEARFQHGKSNLHAKYEKRRNQGPNRVDRVDNVIPFQTGIGRECSESH